MDSSQNGIRNFVLSFKERNNFYKRQQIFQDLLCQQPDKIPIIVERYDCERKLPHLDYSRFRVPSDLTIGDIKQIIRHRLQIHPDQALYLIVNDKSMTSMTQTIGHLYNFEKDEDGFLYFVYTSQIDFGFGLFDIFADFFLFFLSSKILFFKIYVVSMIVDWCGINKKNYLK